MNLSGCKLRNYMDCLGSGGSVTNRLHEPIIVRHVTGLAKDITVCEYKE